MFVVFGNDVESFGLIRVDNKVRLGKGGTAHFPVEFVGGEADGTALLVLDDGSDSVPL